MTIQNKELLAFLEENGYVEIKENNGILYGIMPMIFTTALVCNIDWTGYSRRYCFETGDEASESLKEWDGVGDPPGMWIKEKPSNRMNPAWIDRAV